MTPRSDAEGIDQFLARASRRVALLLVMHGAFTGFAVAVLITGFNWIRRGSWVPPGAESLALVAIGIVLGAIRGWMLRPRIASIVEDQAPQCHNLLITASELMGRNSAALSVGRSGLAYGAAVAPGGPDRPTEEAAYVEELVFRDAIRLIGALDLRRIFPARGALTALAAVTALWLFAASRSANSAAVVSERPLPATARVSVNSVDVEISNPAYLGGPSRSLRDPGRIEVLAGSRMQLTVRADADSVVMETLTGRRVLTMSATRTFTGEFVADADGYVALEPAAIDGRRGVRRLIGISAIEDHPPTVRITAPGRDEKFADSRHTIVLAIDAVDDHALASLRLRYTRVSGSGERFTFTEGDVPLAISRADPRNWKARATWRLDSLALGPGDMVVYRAVVADDRPGAPAVESDSYIAEVLAPGGIAAAGFAVDPEVERYALSQQMVILKTERLLARKPAMATAAFADSAADLAVEQRRVRAEYVFMMGGEVGAADDATGDINEQVEASAEGDLAVQRMLNQGRAALLSAIRAMSRAATALTTPDVAVALTHERTALAQLEKTFAHSKIILRALTERERLDPARRLSGALADAASDAEPGVMAGENQRVLALRRALNDIARRTDLKEGSATAALRISDAARSVLRIDPSSKPAQRVAAQLDSAATALNASRGNAARALLDRAAQGLARMLDPELLDSPFPRRQGDDARLTGALTDALRRRP